MLHEHSKIGILFLHYQEYSGWGLFTRLGDGDQVNQIWYKLACSMLGR
jgi:hypothetical protein